MVEDIRDTTDRFVDVVIATHEHWNHISGFLQAKEVVNEIDFEAVDRGAGDEGFRAGPKGAGRRGRPTFAGERFAIEQIVQEGYGRCGEFN